MTAILDASFFVALLSADDKNHQAAKKLSQDSTEPRMMLSSVVPEAVYVIALRLKYHTAIRFVRSLAQSRMQFEVVTQTDLLRVVELMEQYRDAELDFADCTMVAVAERLNITRLWTFDRRHFPMVRPRHAPHFDLLP